MRLYANTPGREVYEKDEYSEKRSTMWNIHMKIQKHGTFNTQ